MKKYIKSSEDEWDVFQGKKYLVSGRMDFYTTDDPRDAIKQWFKFGQEAPMMANISTEIRQNALELLNAADDNFITKLWNQYRCPYKLDYLLDEITETCQNGCRFFHEGYIGDSIHPFCVG